MQYSELSTKVHDLIKGQFGVNIVAVVSCDKSFSSKFCRFMGRAKKVTLITHARLVSYEGKVDAKKDDGTTFIPAPPKGMRWIDYPYFKQSLKDGKVYLTLHYRSSDKRTEFRHFYLLDDRLATPQEAAEIEACMKSKGSYSNKQAAVGITSEAEQTKVAQYVVEGIRYFGTDKALAEEIYLGIM